MSFESNGDQHMKTLDAKIDTLERQRLDLVHDCDCKYCDWAGEVVDDDQPEYDKLGEQIKDVEASKKLLQRHLDLHAKRKAKA